jgi:hypothetical protein
MTERRQAVEVPLTVYLHYPPVGRALVDDETVIAVIPWDVYADRGWDDYDYSILFTGDGEVIGVTAIPPLVSVTATPDVPAYARVTWETGQVVPLVYYDRDKVRHEIGTAKVAEDGMVEAVMPESTAALFVSQGHYSFGKGS